MTRTDTPPAWDERSIMFQMLDYAQQTALFKVRGLSQDQARLAPIATSPLTTPAALLNHLRWVERSWVESVLLGGEDDGPWSKEDPDAELSEGHSLPLDEVIVLYETQAIRTRALLAEMDFDQLAARAHGSIHPNVRWVVAHLVEETARHNGHLDLLREMADGSVGD